MNMARRNSTLSLILAYILNRLLKLNLISISISCIATMRLLLSVREQQLLELETHKGDATFDAQLVKIDRVDQS